MMKDHDLYLDLLLDALTASLYDESAWTVLESSGSRTKRKPLQYVSRSIQNWGLRRLKRNGYEVIKKKPFQAPLREIGKDKPCFGYSMIGRKRMENIRYCIQQVLQNNIPGDLIETGAWRGGAGIFMQANLITADATDRTVWLADSFEGLPVPQDAQDGWDLSNVDYFKVSVEQVRANFERFHLMRDNVKFIKGWFSESLPTAPIERLAILRLDGDLYSSTMDALTNLYHKVSPGGYVIVDDYYSWPACKRAVTDFLEERKIEADLIAIDESAVYWKVS